MAVDAAPPKEVNANFFWHCSSCVEELNPEDTESPCPGCGGIVIWSYTEYTTLIGTLPKTWVPGILNIIVARILRRKDVFKPGGLIAYVRGSIERTELDMAQEARRPA
jgi:hypothetical protein